MNYQPATRQTLILRLTDQADRDAWEQFVDIYAPIVFQFARRRGLQDSDAADIVQEVLARVSVAFQRRKYDPSRGAFRGWLLTITRNEVFDWLEARSRRERAGGGTADAQKLEAIPDIEEQSAWRRDYHERLFSWASEQVRAEVQPETWQAFWLCTAEQRSGREAAATLGLSVAAVYLAKSRVTKRIRELVRHIDPDDPF